MQIRPTTAAMHVKASEPILKLTLVLVALLAAGCVGGGIVAIVWNAKSPTQFNFLGITMTTGDVGVAMVGIGLASVVLIVRRILKTVEHLAGLRPDHDEPTPHSRR